MYNPVKPVVHSDLDVRGLRYRLHCWGDPNADPVLLLHGWADTGMSFQFLADAMQDRWYLIAPDWRGFGDSGWQPGGYWFPDYLADLEVIIDHYFANGPARMVGHSMGGNVAWMYAGIRPEQVSHAVSLDVYGLPDCPSEQAPGQYRKWLDQLHGCPGFSHYKSLEAIADRITGLAPRLGPDRAMFLAQHWTRQTDDGKYALKHDPAHRRANPVLYRREEVKACWRYIQARALLILAEESAFHERYVSEGYQEEVKNSIRGLSETTVSDSGHMLHLEQPERLAAILEKFLESFT